MGLLLDESVPARLRSGIATRTRIAEAQVVYVAQVGLKQFFTEAVELASKSKKTPTQALAAFLAKYDPAVAGIARAALARLRKRLPGAAEIVYDNYNALAVGFGPGDRASEAILSITVYPRWVTLFFLQGVRLKDPAKLLKGSGTRVRHIVLKKADDIGSPDVEALIAAALEAAARPIDPKSKRQLIIKSVSAKQRARRPG